MRQAFFLFALFILFPTIAFSSELNAGFVQGLWYSSEPVFDGIPTRIYVAVRNNTSHDLTGTVRFADNGRRIGSSDISALSGRLVEAWVDWTPSYGEHTITAQVTNATLHIIGGGTETLDIAGVIEEDILTIDYDTDRDGTGDANDTDDDNDGVSDTDEKERGSNPRVAQVGTEKKDEGGESQILKETQPVTPSSDTVPNDTERGLEKYTSSGITDELLGNATTKIETTKKTLDEYRGERNAELEQKRIAANTESTETPLGTYTDDATITRTKIDAKNNFLNSFVTSVSSILTSFWTFVLYLTSQVLGHPAFLELILLLGIIYLVYRIARRYGRRQRF